MIQFEELLKEAEEKNAAYIHLPIGAAPNLRIRGNLVPLSALENVSREDVEGILKEYLSDKQMAALEKSGNVNAPISISGVGRYRLNAYKQRGTVSIVVKILHTNIASPEDLYIPTNVTELSSRKKGMIVVTGASCSGRSTTVAALIDTINKTRALNIVTLEDPIEYLFRHGKSIISQREVGSDVSSLEEGLSTVQYEDQDVVMISKISDRKSILAALELAESGKVVITEMSTNGVADTVSRIVGSFPVELQPQIKAQVARSLNTVVTQQLIPISGNAGVIPAFEIMHLNQSVRASLVSGDFSNIENRILERSNSSIRMDNYILELYKAGVISSENAVRYARNSKEMMEWIKTA